MRIYMIGFCVCIYNRYTMGRLRRKKREITDDRGRQLHEKVRQGELADKGVFHCE